MFPPHHCPVTTVHIHSATVCFPLSPSCNFTLPLPRHHMVLSGCQLCVFFSNKSRRDADKFACTLVTWSSDVFVSKIPDPLSLLYGCGGDGGSSSCIRHLSLAQGDGQLQVFLLLLSQPLQPLTLCSLTLSLSPLQLLSLIPELHTTEEERETERSSFYNMESTSWLTVYLKVYFQRN